MKDNFKDSRDGVDKKLTIVYGLHLLEQSPITIIRG